MASIKIPLEREELDVVERLAETLNAKPEDIAFYALNRFMLDPNKTTLGADIARVAKGRKDNLARWSDTPAAPQAYESMGHAEGNVKDAPPDEKLG